MIPAEYKQDIIQSGINFMRNITDAYGTDEGMKLWDTIANVLDKDIKGQIFFSLLTGEYNGIIHIHSLNPNGNKVWQIKALRSVSSPNLSLKEAKDLLDNLIANNKSIKINIDAKNRNRALNELRSAGFNI